MADAMGTQRKNPDSIKSMLADIRTYGIKDTKYINKLLKKLTGEDNWSPEQCKRFYEALLREYIGDEQYLRLMLDVSGISKEYACLKNVTDRREKYLLHLKEINPTEERVDTDSLRKNEEEHCLKYLAEKLEEVIKNGESVKLVERLIHEEEEMKDTDKDICDFEQKNEHPSYEENIQRQTSFSLKKLFNINIENFFSPTINIEKRNKQANKNIGGGTQENKTKDVRKNKVSIKLFIMSISIFLLGGGYYIISHSSLPAVTDIVLPPRDITLKPSDYYEIKAAIFPEEASGSSLSYISQDPDVATVSSKGIVLAQGKWGDGESRTTEIIIQAESGATAKQIITVEKDGNGDVFPTEDVEDFEQSYTLQTSVRPAGTKGNNWTDNLEVNIGDELEYQIDYDNVSDETQHDVVLRDILPKNLEYIPGTTRIWNEFHRGDTIDQDDLVTDNGIIIGSYGPGANAYIRFNARVVDEDLACGSNTLVNWGQGWVGDTGIQDYANVHLNKE